MEEKKESTILDTINKIKEESIIGKTIENDAIEKQVSFDFENDEDSELIEESNETKKSAKKVDISKFVIVDKDPISKERDLKNALYGNKSAFQIVAAQSGYMATVTPLVHKDSINLLYSNLNRYEYKKAVYKVIYSKINNFSVGSMTFDEWLKNTSVEDIESFYYGIYCATFPTQGSFKFTCPNCNEETNYKINHNNLFKTTDKEKMRKLIDSISRESRSKEIMREFSLLNKKDAFQLSESGIVIEVRTPSLWDSLELLRIVPENVIDRDTVSVTNMLYINKILIPSKDNENQYSEENDRQEILRLIDNLSIDDANELQDAILEKVDDSRISYSIRNIKCPHCETETREVPISLEDILFIAIFEKAQ